MARGSAMAELEACHVLASSDRVAQDIRAKARRLARTAGVEVPVWALSLTGGAPTPAQLARERGLRKEQTRALLPKLPAEIQSWIDRVGGTVSIQPAGVVLHDARGLARTYPTLTAAVAAVA
jgi:hypothetical protein